MANPNSQLQTALAQFAAQPGLTPAHEAQLRAAMASDARLQEHLNQAATDGDLKGFALSQAGAQPNLTGTYDKASGVVTLPSSSFAPTGTTASADLSATLRLQDMSLRFAHGDYDDSAGKLCRPVTQEMVNNLQSTINGSPVLAQEMKKAVMPPGPGQEAPLQHFAPLSGTVAGGTYSGDTKTMSLPPSSLSGKFNSADMTFVLGHEVQHAFNHAAMAAASQSFNTETRQIAQSNSLAHDYTRPIGKLTQASREDEASAQIAGWNALLSQRQQINPMAGLSEMLGTGNFRVKDFVELGLTPNSAQARPGLTFNPDATLSQTPANIAAAGQYYFDKPPKGTPGVPENQTTGIGFHGDSDYRNYYGAHAVGRAIDMERSHAQPINGHAPNMQVDMSRLGLREDLMERNGITIGNNPGTPQPYNDTSQLPPAPHHFDHTNTPVGMPNSHQHVPVVPGAAGSPGAKAGDPRDPEAVQPSGTPQAQQELSPTADFSAYLDRMLAAAQSGDDASFRKMTQTLADLPPGREVRAEAVATVDQQEQMAAQHQAQLQQAAQVSGPVMRM
ncbi:hypothetical protein [Variovorax paradoxus]|jgi:hypothetical protein|uniref:hypothetical protein n=1 Tax=Variovorax paradoxus TaxID=34073 RepID=UPI0024810C88|nr:hypothetical protein [Variovorax paradoxus]WGT65067.1 hypothetical protein QHG62_06905 [Variovorax paradoxus]